MKILCFFLMLNAGLFSHSKKETDKNLSELDAERFNSRLSKVKAMIRSNSKYHSKIAFFVDMKIKSGKNRFFVYDLENDTILDQGLVAHGSGSETEVKGILKFSNIPNSKSTSLGSYSISNKYKGMFGKAYKLIGLEDSNNNAFKRAIVLHHYSAVPHEEQEYYIARSQGCPMVNELFFKRIEKIIDSSKSSIILDIYY
ncbi:murein L,D-transpeptidase catalytic domain-containing protein [Flavobacterium sp. DG2-3]|uniref:murein L,D-transpeptidase catalytic domain-containing protein n=1 Tax=Flavobacterium sp. DG2-3 TaxID=3068317 RepID=UPI00273F0919|nr:murein L,D-transpeptidase catalytic domain family protein [Flavobacterium sp. DG2-3]MDP5199123.1 murein L,D-transpeptidase catalytic domain family protein [Flavobacterium sp. DG2-3]